MKEPICDTWRGGSKIQQELMGEKWSQGKPVSAGNGGRVREKKQKATDRKIQGNSKQMFSKSNLRITPRARNRVISVRHFCFIGLDSEANADRLDIILESSVCVRLVSQLCPALCNPKDCSPTGSSAHRIF